MPQSVQGHSLTPLLFSLQGFRSLWYSLSSVLHTLQPWHYSLKQISGRFGSSILSYFLFLKTLLMFNFFLFLLLLVFVIAIQAAYPSATPKSVAFTGLEPLTGAVSIHPIKPSTCEGL